jgi:hypothetical protein
MKKVHDFIIILNVFGCCIAPLFFAGCAARPEKMIPPDFVSPAKIPGTVKITEVVGGHESNPFPLWSSQVSSVDYTKAIAYSLVKADIFDSVVRKGKSDYILDVTILSCNQPLIGIDISVTMKTNWVLTDTKKLFPVWSETFETTFKANVTDAVIPAEKSRLAYEGAVRTNLTEGVKRISDFAAGETQKSP